MENTNFRNFLSRFDYLSDSFCPHPEVVDKASAKILELRQVHNANNLVSDAIGEIENNLYQLQPSDRETYVAGIIRRFAEIGPFLNIGEKREYVDFWMEQKGPFVIIGNRMYSKGVATCLKILERYCGWTEPNLDFDSATVPEQYAIECLLDYGDFFTLLDCKCLIFNIDIINVQRGVDVPVYTRDNSELYSLGYNKRLKDVLKDKLSLTKTDDSEDEEHLLSYEKLFKDSKECIRITNLIESEACTNGIFTGFKNIPGSPRNQIKITYQIVEDRFLKPLYTRTKGSIKESFGLFLQRFGWDGFDENILKKPTPNESKPNDEARRELELILK